MSAVTEVIRHPNSGIYVAWAVLGLLAMIFMSVCRNFFRTKFWPLRTLDSMVILNLLTAIALFRYGALGRDAYSTRLLLFYLSVAIWYLSLPIYYINYGIQWFPWLKSPHGIWSWLTVYTFTFAAYLLFIFAIAADQGNLLRGTSVFWQDSEIAVVSQLAYFFWYRRCMKSEAYRGGLQRITEPTC